MRHIKHYALAAICFTLAGCAGRESTNLKFQENDIDKRVLRSEMGDLDSRLRVVEGRVDDVAGTVGVLSTGIYEVKTVRGNKRTSLVAHAPALPREAPLAVAAVTPAKPAPGPAPVPANIETSTTPLSLPPSGVVAPGGPAPIPAAPTPAAPAKSAPAKPAPSAAPAAPVATPPAPAIPEGTTPLPPAITLPSDSAPGASDTKGGRIVLPNAAPAPKGKMQQPAKQPKPTPTSAPASDPTPGLSLPPESGAAPAPRRITSGAKDITELKAGEENAYKAALSLVTSGQGVAGEAKFREFLRDYPSGRYAANAEYWLGEALYTQSKYREALEQFKFVADKYPKHHKTADAMLKAGMSYDRLGDKASASAQYRTLLAEFPQSESAGKIKGKVDRTTLTMNNSQ